jgi:general secretion pathway protein I
MAELLTINKVDTQNGYPFDGCGFTLLEVMIAMAILAIALTGVYRLQNQTMVMSGKARFYSVAPLLAQAKLSETERTDLSDIGNNSGEFGTQYPGYSWSLDAAPVPLDLLENISYKMLRIDLTITLSDEASYVLRTYRFDKE